MKTHLKHALILLFCSVLSVKAQIPNSRMENWAIANNSTDSLIGWSSSNILKTFGPHSSVFKEFGAGAPSPGPYEGNFALGIQSVPNMAVQNASIGAIVNGNAKFGHMATTGMFVDIPAIDGGGTPISYKPTYFGGYYNYLSDFNLTDKGLAIVLLSKYNSALQKRDTVGMGTYQFSLNNNYQKFTIPLIDMMPGVNPDTIITIFYSSDPSLLVNPYYDFSKLYIDSMYVSPQTPSGIEDEKEKIEFNIFPNPSNGNFTINILSENNINAPLEIVDLYGKKIKNIVLIPAEKNIEIHMNDCSNGIYFIKAGAVSKKIIINR